MNIGAAANLADSLTPALPTNPGGGRVWVGDMPPTIGRRGTFRDAVAILHPHDGDGDETCPEDPRQQAGLPGNGVLVGAADPNFLPRGLLHAWSPSLARSLTQSAAGELPTAGRREGLLGNRGEAAWRAPLHGFPTLAAGMFHGAGPGAARGPGVSALHRGAAWAGAVGILQTDVTLPPVPPHNAPADVAWTAATVPDPSATPAGRESDGTPVSGAPRAFQVSLPVASQRTLFAGPAVTEVPGTFRSTGPAGMAGQADRSAEPRPEQTPVTLEPGLPVQGGQVALSPPRGGELLPLGGLEPVRPDTGGAAGLRESTSRIAPPPLLQVGTEQEVPGFSLARPSDGPTPASTTNPTQGVVGAGAETRVASLAGPWAGGPARAFPTASTASDAASPPVMTWTADNALRVLTDEIAFPLSRPVMPPSAIGAHPISVPDGIPPSYALIADGAPVPSVSVAVLQAGTATAVRPGSPSPGAVDSGSGPQGQTALSDLAAWPRKPSGAGTIAPSAGLRESSVGATTWQLDDGTALHVGPPAWSAASVPTLVGLAAAADRIGTPVRGWSPSVAAVTAPRDGLPGVPDETTVMEALHGRGHGDPLTATVPEAVGGGEHITAAQRPGGPGVVELETTAAHPARRLVAGVPTASVWSGMSAAHPSAAQLLSQQVPLASDGSRTRLPMVAEPTQVEDVLSATIRGATIDGRPVSAATPVGQEPLPAARVQAAGGHAQGMAGPGRQAPPPVADNPGSPDKSDVLVMPASVGEGLSAPARQPAAVRRGLRTPDSQGPLARGGSYAADAQADAVNGQRDQTPATDGAVTDVWPPAEPTTPTWAGSAGGNRNPVLRERAEPGLTPSNAAAAAEGVVGGQRVRSETERHRVDMELDWGDAGIHRVEVELQERGTRVGVACATGEVATQVRSLEQPLRERIEARGLELRDFRSYEEHQSGHDAWRWAEQHRDRLEPAILAGHRSGAVPPGRRMSRSARMTVLHGRLGDRLDVIV